MEKEVLRKASQEVIAEVLPDLKDREPKTIRAAFIAKCAFIGYYVATGIKLEGAEVHLKHFAEVKANGGMPSPSPHRPTPQSAQDHPQKD
jgi:hypothetical protein